MTLDHGRVVRDGDPFMKVRRVECETSSRLVCQGREPILDLASVESTAPDGAARDLVILLASVLDRPAVASAPRP